MLQGENATQGRLTRPEARFVAAHFGLVLRDRVRRGLGGGDGATDTEDGDLGARRVPNERVAPLGPDPLAVLSSPLAGSDESFAPAKRVQESRVRSGWEMIDLDEIVDDGADRLGGRPTEDSLRAARPVPHALLDEVDRDDGVVHRGDELVSTRRAPLHGSMVGENVAQP